MIYSLFLVSLIQVCYVNGYRKNVSPIIKDCKFQHILWRLQHTNDYIQLLIKHSHLRYHVCIIFKYAKIFLESNRIIIEEFYIDDLLMNANSISKLEIENGILINQIIFAKMGFQLFKRIS